MAVVNHPRHRWLLAWLALSLLGALAIATLEMRRQAEAFYVDCRIAHRLLSQRAVQHDAVLAMLALQPVAAELPQQGLAAIFPQILRVERRHGDQRWAVGSATQAVLEAAEAESRRRRHAVTAGGDFARGRVWLVLAAAASAQALEVDLAAPVTSPEWPASLATATRVELVFGEAGARTAFALEDFRPDEGLRSFDFRKLLAADSQPYEVVIRRSFGWRDLPWRAVAVWLVLVAAGLAAYARYVAQTRARRRAEELLRLGQATRLNALGELAAGMTHELNQPLTAVMANTQAAGRLLDEDPPDLDTARTAMQQAVSQARRAAEVLGRLRRTVEPATGAEPRTALALMAAGRQVLELLEPECRSRGVEVVVDGESAVTVLADPVALEQILHNLVSNALQALEQVPAGQRRLRLATGRDRGMATLSVSDSGPGIPEDALPRLFEPFFTTRAGGLGLGLSLSETLAASLGGRLEARNHDGGGAVFTVFLPLVQA